MRLPTPLLRHEPRVHKNTFGHALILAGSPGMLGAAALSALACLRTGAGLVTVGIPRGLNLTLQKKISPAIMTLPLAQTRAQTLAFTAFTQIRKRLAGYSVLALGPGMTPNASTQKLVLKLIATASIPQVIDADALNAVARHPRTLLKTSTAKILTPHPGEMSRLTGLGKLLIEKDRKKAARDFAAAYCCVVVLKGHHTVIASCDGKAVVNQTGNSGLATAGSGDVLTGMIAALLAQGIPPFPAACWAVYLHGLAADLAFRTIPAAAMIATDVINHIPSAMKKAQTP